jgi:hypothetical protein
MSPAHGSESRLNSWKEIAAYLNRDVRTVQRWEKTERLPVHRHAHEKQSSVYALQSELDAWLAERSASPPAINRRKSRRTIAWSAATALGLGLVVFLGWRSQQPSGSETAAKVRPSSGEGKQRRTDPWLFRMRNHLHRNATRRRTVA